MIEGTVTMILRRRKWIELVSPVGDFEMISGERQILQKKEQVFVTGAPAASNSFLAVGENPTSSKKINLPRLNQ